MDTFGLTRNRPSWFTAGGLPSRHVARAALHVAAVIDEQGSLVVDARESYWTRATGGLFPPADLQLGERLLVDCGWMIERDGHLVPSSQIIELLHGTTEDAIAVLCARAIALFAPAEAVTTDGLEGLEDVVTDPQRREQILLALGSTWDDLHQRTIGEIGEEVVVRASRAELEALGHPELARAVRRVSLESDQLGYDISAPRVNANPRLLEVKATTTETTERFAVYLSRNEAETAKRFSDWALVVCGDIDVDDRSGSIIGWCNFDRIRDALPVDVANSRWEQTRVWLSPDMLADGLPRPSA